MKSQFAPMMGQRGSAGNIIIGFLMMCAGFYLLLHAIVITESFFLGAGLYRLSYMGGMQVTGGMLLIPLLIGIGIIFYNTSNLLGWALAGGSLAALIVGVIVNTHLSLRSMSLFELLMIFVLAFGGLGLFLRGYRDGAKRLQEPQ